MYIFFAIRGEILGHHGLILLSCPLDLIHFLLFSLFVGISLHFLMLDVLATCFRLRRTGSALEYGA